MSRNNKIDIGRILKAHNALFNYIKDSYGFRVGVVVMMKGPDRDTPKIGWALFNETPYRQYGRITETLGEIPAANERFSLILESAIELCKSLPEPGKRELPSMVNIYNSVMDLKKMKLGSPESMKFYKDVITNKGKADLISLAIKRANTNRDNYFAYESSIPHDRCNQSEIKWDYNWIPINKPDSNVVIKSAILAQAIKRAVREAEYRAWRYFK